MASIKSRVRAAVKGVLAALTIPGINAANIIERRAIAPNMLTACPGIVVVTLKPRVERELFSGKQWLWYPALVLLVLGRDANPEDADLEDDTRQQIAAALCVNTLAGVSEVFDHEFVPDPPLPPLPGKAAAFPENFNLSPMRFDYLAAKPRNG